MSKPAPPSPLTETAEVVLERRYYLKDENGQILENWDSLCRRVANAVASVNGIQPDTQDLAQRFFQMIHSLDFLPNSPCLMNAGTDLGQLSACFVLPVEDSMDGIFTSIRNGALVHKTGGGTGYSFSRLRPKNAAVKSTQGVASGPLSFAAVFDAATETIKQGGKRRGANMGVLRCLAGKTLIHTTEGKKPIAELVGQQPLVYCCDPKTRELHIAKAERVFVSDRNRNMVRVTLDNDTSIECTPDHRFMLSDGSYVEACHLKTGASLMAFHKCINKHGNSTRYVRVAGCTGGRSVYEHRLIAKDILGIEVNDAVHVHHKDGNALNNSLSNLEIVSRSEHAKRHDSNLEICRRKILASRKGRTLEETYGKEKADEWKRNMRVAKERRTTRELPNHKVVSVENIGIAEQVYDMTVPDWHNFVAEEVFVHNCDHPDILAFIKAKEDQSRYTNFNFSVAITDAFMRAVRDDTVYDLVNPATGEITESLMARQVFDEIVDRAWHNGEPGVLFIDAANRDNATPQLGDFEATNPCGEQWLLPYESCNLGSINLARYVRDGKVDKARLAATVRLAVRFLDNVIDCNRFPIPEIAEMTLKTRKVGLGIMGLHDMLIQLELPYASEAGRAQAAEVMDFIHSEAEQVSEELAAQKGAFPAYDPQYNSYPARRNAALTSIQPTGTVSMIADCASGCEPYFSIVMVKNVMDGDRLLMVNRLFEQVARREGFYSKELMEKVAESGTVVGQQEIPEKWQEIFRTAQDIAPEDHIRMQGALQKSGVDSSISKTINMPTSASRDDVKSAYLLAHELGCKGLTVYRDGSREGQVLNAGKAVKEQSALVSTQGLLEKTTLPDVLNAKRYRLKDVNQSTIYLIVCFDEEENPMEVFAKFPFDNRLDLKDKSTMWTTTCRLVSLALRYQIPMGEIIRQLDRSSGHRLDLPAQLSRLLKSFMAGTHHGFSSTCPECKGRMVFEEGCEHCVDCGYSKCA